MNKVVLITGSAGLIGSEAARFFSARGFRVVGIDNDMRAQLVGADASTAWNRERLIQDLPNYVHASIDIRDSAALEEVFRTYESVISLIVHTAAQPSHDWAARDPHADFTINANGTLNLLELTRRY